MHDAGEHNDPNQSHHEEFKAYNEGEGKEEENEATPGPDGIKKVPCRQLLRNMDKAVIKPFLIYNYEEKAHKNQMQNEVFGVETRKSQIASAPFLGGIGGTEVLDARRSNPYNFPSPSNPQAQIEMANYQPPNTNG